MTWNKGQSGNPSGRPKKKQPSTRLDGWQNVLTGMGTARDKRGASTYLADVVDFATAQELWLTNDQAARIVEIMPHEMLRAGWDVRIQADDDADAEDVRQQEEDVCAVAEDLGVEHIAEMALKYERAYGGAAIYPVVNDGTDDLTSPLDMERVSSLSHFVLFQPRECVADISNGDITDPNFGEPDTYRISPVSRGPVEQTGFPIHYSRLILLRGIRTSRYEVHSSFASWGGSVLQRVAVALRDWGVAYESAAALMMDMSQAVYKMKNLSQMMAANEDTTVRKQLELFDTMRSIMRMAVIDSEDDWERKTTPLAGVKDIMDKADERLAAAAQMPLTLLMGRSPGGMNSTGESDRAFYYDQVAHMQRVKLLPILEKITKLIFGARMIGPEKEDSPTGGVEPDVWSIQFRPLWEPSQKEETASRYAQAQADQIYLANGVLTPEEVAASRFGGDEYSYAMTIDMEARQKMADARSAMEVQPVAMPGQTTPEAEAAKKQAADTAAKAAAGGDGVNDNVRTDALETRLDYSPDQERDENGRWSGGATGGAGGSVITLNEHERAGTISVAPSGLNDHAAMQEYHAKVAIFERARGNHDLSQAHEKVSEKYAKRAARARSKDGGSAKA